MALPVSTDPTTEAKYDNIWVIVDKLTKYAYFIPFLSTATSEQLAFAFIREVFSRHGLPEQIISDRDKLFTSKFWTSLMKRLGTKQKLSTTAHPQTDGQTERLNQTLEQYLRGYVNFQQDNWVELLPLAQYAYNTSVNETMKMTPHEAVYGQKPVTTRQEISDTEAPEATSSVPRAEMMATKIKATQQRLQQELQFLQNRMAHYYNKKRIEGPTLKVGDKVYLLRDKQHSTLKTSQIKTKRPSDKLEYKKLGAFKIKEVLSKNNYRLSLPKSMQLRTNVFHISMLEPAPEDAELDKNLELEEDPDEYEVEKIMDSAGNPLSTSRM